MDRDFANTMDAYHLHRPDSAKGRRRLVIFLLIGVVVWVALAAAYSPIKVTVDGTTYTMPAGTTAGELVKSGLVKAPRGDLLSLAGGVARERAGGPPKVLVDGKDVAASDRLSDGARVTSVKGRDSIESAITTVAATPIPVVETGTGPDTTLDSIGAPGLAVVKMGAVSHSIVDSRTIVAASPMRVRRTPLATGTMVVALTFDDGPWPGQTEQILDILRRERVQATFFMLGVRVRAHQDLVRRVVAEGHTLGSHSMTHPDLTRSSPAVVEHQMAVSQGVIREVTGIQTPWFRAPGGSVNSVVQAQADRLGMRVIRWTTDPADWRKPPASEIVARVTGGLSPGAVVLMHDGGGDRTQTIAALPEIIRIGRERGYRFVTLDEMYAKD